MRHGIVVMISAAFLLLPSAAAAVTGIPIGGKVVSIFPCLHNAGYLYAVAGFGIGSGVFWFVPGTLVYPIGPPVVGEWILGMAAPAGTCGAATLYEGTGI